MHRNQTPSARTLKYTRVQGLASMECIGPGATKIPQKKYSTNRRGGPPRGNLHKKAAAAAAAAAVALLLGYLLCLFAFCYQLQFLSKPNSCASW